MNVVAIFTFNLDIWEMLSVNIVANTCVCLASLQFACDTKSLAQCVAEELNTSAALVTPCLIRSLNVSVEGGLETCPSEGPSCPFPEVCHSFTVCVACVSDFERRMSHLHLCLSEIHH